MEHEQLWVEPVGNLIIARLRGMPTEQLLRVCQERVLQLASETGKHCVLYDLLEAEGPAPTVAWSQRKLDEDNASRKLRRAIVVPNTKLAYLARLAFGGSEHRVFYSDMVAAIQWLEDTTSPCAEPTAH